jgi:hypothetical protein
MYYWTFINHPIIKTLKNNLNMFDEYMGADILKVGYE